MSSAESLYAARLARLYALASAGRTLGLERMEAACQAFGNPERQFKVVHIAGTNGKGSVAAFTASMLRAGGQRTGLFTSPHLQRYAERIQIDGDPVDETVLGELIEEVLDRDLGLSFFEATTMICFLAFQRAGVEVAVLEVGLGGRLDATNIVPPPAIAAVTRIAFDHRNVLGDSLRQIAVEKAAIIKPGSKVVTGRLHPDARDAVAQRVAEVGAEWVTLGDPEPFPGAQLAYPRMAMFGANLAVANTIGRELGIAPEDRAKGIEQTFWPGRNELLHRNGQELTLLDCAHNPDAAVTLCHVVDATLVDSIGSRKQVALVFGALRTKNWQAMLDRLEHTASLRFYVAPPVATAADPYEMAHYLSGQVVENVAGALKAARAEVGSRGLVIVTGSVFLVGAARAFLLGQPLDPPITM